MKNNFETALLKSIKKIYTGFTDPVARDRLWFRDL